MQLTRNNQLEWRIPFRLWYQPRLLKQLHTSPYSRLSSVLLSKLLTRNKDYSFQSQKIPRQAFDHFLIHYMMVCPCLHVVLGLNAPSLLSDERVLHLRVLHQFPSLYLLPAIPHLSSLRDLVRSVKTILCPSFVSILIPISMWNICSPFDSICQTP